MLRRLTVSYSSSVFLLVIYLVCDFSIYGECFRMYSLLRRLNINQDYQNSLQSPCPNIFQYQNDENGNLVGSIRVDQIEVVTQIQLNVELSVGNSVPENYNGKIILGEDRQKIINNIINRQPIYYRLLFPAWQNIPPRITKISVNGNLICNGPTIPFQMVQTLTTIKLQHKLTIRDITPSTPLISSPEPAVESSNIYNNIAPAPSSSDQNNQSPFDVRRNNQFPRETKSEKSIINSNNPYLNINNPFNFNPSGTPPPRVEIIPASSPSSNNRPQIVINPQNPFLNGLSTPRSPTEENHDGSSVSQNNPFFNPRSTEASPSSLLLPVKSSSNTRNSNEICGRPQATNSLVINGQDVPRGAYPWLVAIFRQLEHLSLSYICSGSLISDRHVVTAAHCVKLEYRKIKPNEIVCIFGKLNIKKWVTAPGEKILEPESIVIHPDYEPGKANADIAVMTFPDRITFSNTILPLCLWEGNNDLREVVGDVGLVVGWGRDENGEIGSAGPRQVKMPIVDQLECLKGGSTSSSHALVEIVSKNTFCAGYRNGSGPCNGDSGTAFLLRKNNIFYLRGLVSTALSEATERSCNLKEYVVFTDASKYLDWLMNLIESN